LSNTEETKNTSRSFYAYTALIFIVAILMIILAFFGQSNLEKNQEIPTHSEGKTITEKSAALSDENLALRDKISDMSEVIEKQESELLMAQTVNQVNSQLIGAQILVEIGNIDGARAMISTIDKASLTGDSLTIYKILEAKTAAEEIPQE